MEREEKDEKSWKEKEKEKRGGTQQGLLLEFQSHTLWIMLPMALCVMSSFLA